MRMDINIAPANAPVVNLRCPACGHVGAFHPVANLHDASWQQTNGGHPPHTPFQGGVRQCPNTACKAVVFVILKQGQLFSSFPPEVIDFDSANIPQRVRLTLEEAIRCHSASCYKASALMVRRVLEELCEDKEATGNTLKDRLNSLEKTIVVPKELLLAADELRLLGNDAAHVEAKDYDAIGKEEASLAIELAKELLKAVYQYANLVEKLKALKKA